MNIRIAICDDDALIIEQLQKYITQYFRNRNLSCPEIQRFTSGNALLADETDYLIYDYAFFQNQQLTKDLQNRSSIHLFLVPLISLCMFLMFIYYEKNLINPRTQLARHALCRIPSPPQPPGFRHQRIQPETASGIRGTAGIYQRKLALCGHHFGKLLQGRSL